MYRGARQSLSNQRAPRMGFEPMSEAPQASRISKLPYRGNMYSSEHINPLHYKNNSMHR